MTKPPQTRNSSSGYPGVCAAILVLLSACGGSASDGAAPDVLTAATLGEQTVLSPAEYLSHVRYAGADLENGAREAQLCRACHTLEQGGRALLGPNLYGMFGQAAGARDDYEYSRALAESNFVWTPRALEAWLKAPARFLPGNRMSFGGLADDRKRAELVAYLLKATAEPGE